MSESIRAIRFSHFRGLPANNFKLKGKSLVLLGSNGKGKSAFVDGIEFVFSGQVSRFVGTGTGGIDHDDAVRHVKRLGIPEVTLTLSPSNGTISRKLGSDTPTITDRDPEKKYFDLHPGVDAFILRRAKILDFVSDQDADRYKKFVQLLGITHVDNMQRILVETERRAIEVARRTKSTLNTKLAIFKEPGAIFPPASLKQIFTRMSGVVQTFGLQELTEWSDVATRLPLLKAMRPEVNKNEIDALTRAIVILEAPLPLDVGADITSVNRLRKRLEELRESSADAPRRSIIIEGLNYLGSHATEESCPLCEIPFEQPLADVLLRLKQRSDALRELNEVVAARRAALNRIERYAESITSQLRKDLEHAATIEPDTTQILRDSCASSLRWSRMLMRGQGDENCTDVVVPQRLSVLASVRGACLADLNARKAALVPPDSSILESAITFLERGIETHAEIAHAEASVALADALSARATAAKNAFSKSRENAIQRVFEKIAETVLDLYRRLHDIDEPDERSECTALELKPTSRAAAGGLRLAIKFLGLTESRDPRAFLSEGHLDSLGLCIFLATVRIFNPPGTLLVLDDVLTSIDKEHRRRVGELLFQDFSDYQVVITTHDEHWHDLLSSAARAWGIQGKWSFMKVETWTVDTGPSLSEVDNSWEFVDAHLTEADYRELGGPFRLILEDFLKRTAVNLQLKVKYRIDGKYTAGDFVFAGIHDAIRDALIKLDPSHETDIRTGIGRVFGQGDLVNFLSHDSHGRLEVTLDQARDFVRGIRDLTKRCEDNKLIKGR